jgi:hypothetical protein
LRWRRLNRADVRLYELYEENPEPVTFSSMDIGAGSSRTNAHMRGDDPVSHQMDRRYFLQGRAAAGYRRTYTRT